MISAVPAIVSVAVAALLAVASYSGGLLVLATVVLMVLGIAAGWGALLGLPDPRGTGVTVAVTGLGGVAVAHSGLTSERPLAGFSVLLAIGVLVAFMHELARRDGRPELARSVTATFVGQMISVLGAAWMLLPATRVGDRGVILAAAATAVAAVVVALPWPLRLAGWLALAGGAGAGVGVAMLMVPGVEAGRAAAVGAAISSVFAVLYRMLVNEPGVRHASATLAAGLAPLAACGTAAYAAARLVVG